MYVVGARVTFPNELTKQSIKSYMTSELEGMNKMIMSFKIDTSSTQHLVINAFPSKKHADAFNNSIKDKVQQIHEVSSKVERFEGETLDFYLSIADVGELK